MSASPSAPRVYDSRVDWNTLPIIVNPKGCQDIKVQHLTGKIFAGLSAVATAATTWAFFKFTAAPVVVITTVSSLALLSLALGIVGVALIMRKPGFNDSQYCLEQRQKAGVELEKGMAYPTIQTQFKELLKRGILNNSDLNKVLHKDLQSRDYSESISRHSEAIVDILDEENKTLLKNKYITYIRSNPPQDGLLKFANDKTYIKFGSVPELKVVILATWIQANPHCPYEAFIAANGESAISTISDGKFLNHLKGQFFTFVQEKKQGLVECQSYKSVCHQFDKSGATFQELAGPILTREATEYKENYPQFHARNWTKEAEAIISQNPTLKATLKDTFVHKTNRDMLGEKFKKDREILEVSTEDCIEAINEVAKTMTYLGSKGFRQTYDVSLVEKNKIIQENKTRFAVEISNHISKSGNISDVEKFTSKELNALGIDLKKLLKARWDSKTIQEILTQDSQTFSWALKTHFEAKDWRKKALEDTQKMSIKDLIKSNKALFELGVLKAESNLKERLEKEIASMATFGQLMTHYSKAIFELKLISLDFEKLYLLVAEHLRDNAKTVLFENGLDIFAGLSLPQIFQDKIYRAKEQKAAEEQRTQESLKKLAADFETGKETIHKEAETAIALAAKVLEPFNKKVQDSIDQIASQESDKIKANSKCEELTTSIPAQELILQEMVARQQQLTPTKKGNLTDALQRRKSGTLDLADMKRELAKKQTEIQELNKEIDLYLTKLAAAKKNTAERDALFEETSTQEFKDRLEELRRTTKPTTTGLFDSLTQITQTGELEEKESKAVKLTKLLSEAQAVLDQQHVFEENQKILQLAENEKKELSEKIEARELVEKIKTAREKLEASKASQKAEQSKIPVLESRISANKMELGKAKMALDEAKDAFTLRKSIFEGNASLTIKDRLKQYEIDKVKENEIHTVKLTTIVENFQDAMTGLINLRASRK